MPDTDLLRRVAAALATVTNPQTGKDLVLSGMIKFILLRRKLMREEEMHEGGGHL